MKDCEVCICPDCQKQDELTSAIPALENTQKVNALMVGLNQIIDIYQRKRKEINDRTDELGRRYRKSLHNVKHDCVSLALLRKERYLQDNIFLLNNYRTHNHEIN